MAEGLRIGRAGHDNPITGAGRVADGWGLSAGFPSRATRPIKLGVNQKVYQARSPQRNRAEPDPATAPACFASLALVVT
jgi:hypothetical protein